MKNRLKFRTYIPDLKFFKYWGWQEEGHYVGFCATGDYSLAELLQDYTGQCTGLTDRNGVLIYEDDIIKIETQNGILTNYGIVGFSEKRLCYLRTANLKDKEFQYSFWYNDSLEVVGNVYENMDILEGNNENF